MHILINYIPIIYYIIDLSYNVAEPSKNNTTDSVENTKRNSGIGKIHYTFITILLKKKKTLYTIYYKCMYIHYTVLGTK